MEYTSGDITCQDSPEIFNKGKAVVKLYEFQELLVHISIEGGIETALISQEVDIVLMLLGATPYKDLVDKEAHDKHDT
jgi:hypothetical protein